MYITSVKCPIFLKQVTEFGFISRFDSIFHHPNDDAESVRAPSPPCGNYLNLKKKKSQKTYIQFIWGVENVIFSKR